VDVRVIATTNRRLEQSVERGEFREDLYFRLNVVPIHVPPLRERLEDVPYLAEQFAQRYGRKHGVRVRGLSPEALAVLMAHRWPGNVRELQNVIERAVILCGTSGVLEPEHLGLPPGPSPVAAARPAAPIAPPAPSLTPLAPPAAPAPASEPSPPAEAMLSLAELEKRHILAALDRYGWNRTRAAQALGISSRTLRNKLKEYHRTGNAGPAAESAPSSSSEGDATASAP
jgi:DNA-binding NtrC family response regulator